MSRQSLKLNFLLAFTAVYSWAGWSLLQEELGSTGYTPWWGWQMTSPTLCPYSRTTLPTPRAWQWLWPSGWAALKILHTLHTLQSPLRIQRSTDLQQQKNQFFSPPQEATQPWASLPTFPELHFPACKMVMITLTFKGCWENEIIPPASFNGAWPSLHAEYKTLIINSISWIWTTRQALVFFF